MNSNANIGYGTIEAYPIGTMHQYPRKDYCSRIWSIMAFAFLSMAMIGLISQTNRIHEEIQYLVSRECYGNRGQEYELSQTNPILENNYEANSEIPAANNAKVLIAYVADPFLDELAQSIRTGAAEALGNTGIIQVKTIDVASFEDVLWADAVILGSPVKNANMDPRLQLWINSWDFHPNLSQKVGSAFVAAGGISAGEELTMMNILQSMMVFRLIAVGGDHWTSAFGASAITGEAPFGSSPRHAYFPTVCYQSKEQNEQVNQMFLDKGIGLGRRVAKVAQKMVNG